MRSTAKNFFQRDPGQQDHKRLSIKTPSVTHIEYQRQQHGSQDGKIQVNHFFIQRPVPEQVNGPEDKEYMYDQGDQIYKPESRQFFKIIRVKIDRRFSQVQEDLLSGVLQSPGDG
jgi:ribonuclease I